MILSVRPPSIPRKTANGNGKPKCNNCGGNGHLFFNCKRPITSLGIVCFRVNLKDEIEYLLIQRKDTLGYVDFLRGKYNELNDFQLRNIFLSADSCINSFIKSELIFFNNLTKMLEKKL